MEVKSYFKGMLFVAIPVSYVGFMLAVLSTHSGGAFLFIALCLAPGVWVGDQVVGNSNIIFWLIFTLTQFLYWSIIVVTFNKRRRVDANST